MDVVDLMRVGADGRLPSGDAGGLLRESGSGSDGEEPRGCCPVDWRHCVDIVEWQWRLVARSVCSHVGQQPRSGSRSEAGVLAAIGRPSQRHVEEALHSTEDPLVATMVSTLIPPKVRLLCSMLLTDPHTNCSQIASPSVR